jgi:hypothetical protein
MSRGRSATRRALLRWLLSLALLSCSRGGPKKEEGMSPEPAADMVRQCLGRFCLDVHKTMARSADTYEVQGVQIEELAWPAQVKNPWEQTFLARIARIEALKAEREDPGDPQGNIRERRTFKPNLLQGAYFYRYDNPELGTWGALLDAGTAGAWFQIDADSEHYEQAAQRLTEVANAYRLLEAGVARPTPGKNWFYLRQGVISLPFQLGEEAHARFEGHPLKVKLDVTLETVFEIEQKGLMERFASALEKSGGTLLGASIPVRSGKRQVAGLPGEEMILKSNERNRSNLHFLWTTPGKVSSGNHPKIVVEMESSADQTDEKMALWDILVNSIRPVN